MTNHTDTSDDDAPQNQRAAKRQSIFLGAEVHHGEALLTGRVRNISATGAYLEVEAQLAAGDPLFLSFRGFDRLATRGVGVHFDKPIDPSRCWQTTPSAGQAAHFEPVRNVAVPNPPKIRPRLKLFGVKN